MSKFYILVVIGVEDQMDVQVGHVHDTREAAAAEAEALVEELGERPIVEEHDDGVIVQTTEAEKQEMTAKWAMAMRRAM